MFGRKNAFDQAGSLIILPMHEVAGLELPFLTLEIACSKGTYIRSLAEEIGNLLGTGAHLVALERTLVGRFGKEHAVVFEEIATGTFDLLSIQQALAHLPDVWLHEAEVQKIRSGQQIDIPEGRAIPEGCPLLLLGKEGESVGIGMKISNKIKAERMFNLS